MFWQILKYTVTSYIRNKQELIYIYGSFVVVIVLYAHNFSMSASLQQAIASTVIWVNLMISFMLSLPLLFQREAEEGILDQWILLPQHLSFTVLAKWIGYWISVIFPIMLLIPVLSVFLHIPDERLLNLCVGLLVGSVAMLAIGSIGASATVNMGIKSEVLIMLIFPFYLPILLFGASIVEVQGVVSTYVIAALAAVLTPLSLVITTHLLRSST